MEKTQLKALVPIAVALALSASLSAHEGEEPPTDGALTVLAVALGGPAEAAGVHAGDRLVELAGEEVASLDELARVTARHAVGEEVPVKVERGGELLELALTFGEREGRPSLGLSLALMGVEGREEFVRAQTEGLDPAGCLAWVDERYRLTSVAAALGYDLGAEGETLRGCIKKDLDRMPSRIPRRWCDNVFKVHCSGLDLLTSLGEAQVAWCEGVLEDSLGIDPGKIRAWTACAENRVFERFSVEGSASDAAACRAALEECGYEADAEQAG